MIFVIFAIVLLILCLAGICSDIAIIYTIFRFKRLRTAFNIFLANWAIADLCSVISIPINYGITAISGPYNRDLECVLMQAALIFHVTEILFGIVLSVDWCLAAYFQRLSEKFRKCYRYVIASVWIASLLCYGLDTSLCLSRMNFLLTLIVFLILYSVNFIFVVVLQCSRFAQRYRTLPISYSKALTLRLTLITVITLSYLIAVISMIILFIEIFYIFNQYLLLSGIIAACAIVSSSIVTLILLCCLNYDFRKCLFQLRKPAHERFDNSVSEIEDVVKSPPEILYQTSTQTIIANGNQNSIS